jgi:hypothetical protein
MLIAMVIQRARKEDRSVGDLHVTAGVHGGTVRAYLIIGMVAAVGLCGCSRGRATQQEHVVSTTAENVERVLTVTGCLVPAATTTQSTAARPSTGPPPPDFTLVNATTPGQGADAHSEVSGTSGAGERVAGTPRSYDLVADKNRLDDLQRFANSWVEVSGSVVMSSGGAAGAAADVRRLRIKDVRQLEPTCDSKKQ